MHDYVDVFVADCSICLGKSNGFRENRFCDGWVKTVDVEKGERMLLPVGYAVESISYISCVYINYPCPTVNHMLIQRYHIEKLAFIESHVSATH